MITFTRYRIATEDAQLRFPEALVGIIPGALGTQLLPRLAPFDVCVRMCSGKCDLLDSKAALTYGVVDQIIPAVGERNMARGSNEALESYLARVVKIIRKQVDR